MRDSGKPGARIPFLYGMSCNKITKNNNNFLTVNIRKRPYVSNFVCILMTKNKLTLVNVAKFIKCGLDM